MINVWPPRILIDRRRARRFLLGALELLLALPFWLLGALVALVARVLELLWIALLWIVGATLAGWSAVWTLWRTRQ